jgi:hypothetical protein
MYPRHGHQMLNCEIWQPSYHQGRKLPNKEMIKNNMKTYEGKACFMYVQPQNYCFVTT